MRKIRVLIVDDHDVVRSGLKALLRTSEEYAVVGEAADGEEGVRLVDELSPDLVLTDISMPKLDGIGATRLITQRHPGVKVIVLTVYEDEEYVYQILRAGASGYLLKNASKTQIFKAIKAVMDGERFFSPGISRLIVDGFLKRAEAQESVEPPAPAGGQLTKREVEVLRYIALGLTNREIAEKLFLSFRTVNTHRANIMQKLDIHDTAGLVRHAIATGVVDMKSEGKGKKDEGKEESH